MVKLNWYVESQGSIKEVFGLIVDCKGFLWRVDGESCTPRLSIIYSNGQTITPLNDEPEDLIERFFIVTFPLEFMYNTGVLAK